MDIILTFVFYFLVFAVIHSLLATDYIKNKIKNRIGNIFRFYRLIYAIISFLMIIPVFMIWVTYTSSTPHVYRIPGFLRPFFLLIRFGALGMSIYAAYQVNILEFTGIKQETKSKLITRGAYGIVRHPLYISGIIMLFTKADMDLLDLTAALLISVYLIIGAFIEERRLLSVFGEQYKKYQQQVSMFIPVKWIIKIKSHNPGLN